MAYLMIACSVYLYIATLGVNVRICRDERRESLLFSRVTMDRG
jgi:hypothetical protein